MPKWKLGKGISTTTSALLHRPADHFGVVNHLLQRDRQRGGMALNDHRKAIAHQNPLDAGGIDQTRLRIIVSGQHGDLLAGRPSWR